MTKEDYIKFAAMLQEEKRAAEYSFERPFESIERFKILIANIFAADNLQFNRHKFYRACEPQKD